MSFTWQVRPTQAWTGLAQAYAAQIRAGVNAVADQWAATLETEMKNSAPWTDRTGNARQTLTARKEPAGRDAVAIVLRHGMEYGIYLEGFTPEGWETAQGGRFAIIGPTIDRYAPRVWDDVVALMR